MKYRIPKRTGFTLIELMVAATLSLVIMTIMALAFQSAMGTLSTLKATGDQADRLRTAEVMLRADLDADHVVINDDGGTAKISDLRFDNSTPTLKGGYFAITTGSIIEGYDSEVPSPGIPSTKMSSSTANTITMTVKRTSRTPADLFGTAAGGGVGKVSDTLGNNDNSQWAEVKWQLGTMHSIGGVNMWPLHRTMRVFKGTPPTTPTAASLVPLTGTALGDDIVLTNVLSFEVKPLLIGPTGAFVAGVDTPYSDTPFDTAGGGGNVAGSPQKNRCVAVQVRIRLYDVKTKLTRQMTLIVKV